MHDKKELCEKIKSIYPDIGECGIEVDVDYNETKKAWVVDLNRITSYNVCYTKLLREQPEYPDIRTLCLPCRHRRLPVQYRWTDDALHVLNQPPKLS